MSQTQKKTSPRTLPFRIPQNLLKNRNHPQKSPTWRNTPQRDGGRLTGVEFVSLDSRQVSEELSGLLALDLSSRDTQAAGGWSKTPETRSLGEKVESYGKWKCLVMTA